MVTQSPGQRLKAARAVRRHVGKLSSSHGLFHVHGTFDSGEDGTDSRTKATQKRQVPPTPWTQAHPTAAHRPRTSVRMLMLNQKELRRQVSLLSFAKYARKQFESPGLIHMRTWQHIAQQENRRLFQMKRLERLKKDLEIREKAEQLKLSKKLRWRQALDQVDAKIADMKVQYCSRQMWTVCKIALHEIFSERLLP